MDLLDEVRATSSRFAGRLERHSIESVEDISGYANHLRDVVRGYVPQA